MIYRSPLLCFLNFLKDYLHALEFVIALYPKYTILVGGDFNCRIAQLNQMTTSLSMKKIKNTYPVKAKNSWFDFECEKAKKQIKLYLKQCKR